MNWDAIGAIGDLISALAVVATLIYFGVQIRGMESAEYANRLNQIVGANVEIFKMELEYAELILRGNRGEQLNELESFQIDRIFRAHNSFAFHGHRREVASGPRRIRSVEFARVLVQNPVYLAAWRSWREREIKFNSVQVDWIDTVEQCLNDLGGA